MDRFPIFVIKKKEEKKEEKKVIAWQNLSRQMDYNQARNSIFTFTKVNGN